MIHLFTLFAQIPEGDGGGGGAAAAELCDLDSGSFLNFPTWYKYLDGVKDSVSGLCSPQIGALDDMWLILAAVLEILLRIAALAAVFAVIFGGFTYLTSQGEPEKTVKARMTIITGIGGLLVAILASVMIGFIAGAIN